MKDTHFEIKCIYDDAIMQAIENDTTRLFNGLKITEVSKPIKCQCCPHIETSQLICCPNQLTGFYTRATLALNKLNKNGCHLIKP